MEEGRGKVTAGGGVTRQAVAGSRCSKNTEEEQQPLQAKAPPQKRRAVTRVESAGDVRLSQNPSGLWKENEEEMEEVSFAPSAVSELRWALHMCDNK